MNDDLKTLWSHAYKLAHVAADITEKQQAGKECDHLWLREVARGLNCTAQAITSRLKGERTESLSND